MDVVKHFGKVDRPKSEELKECDIVSVFFSSSAEDSNQAQQLPFARKDNANRIILPAQRQ